MDNLSKALTIAGGMLIAVLVVSLLVLFFNNLQDLMNTNQTIEVTEQAAEFNKPYEVYYRDNLYGSEILSIANKIDDYNVRQAEEEDYIRIDMQIKFKSQLKAGDDLLISNKTYSHTELLKIKEKIDQNIDYYGKKTAGKTGKLISALSGYRTNDLKDLLGDDYLAVQELINSYSRYKSVDNTLKSKVFKVDKYEYDGKNGKKTGRITKMIFEEK